MTVDIRIGDCRDVLRQMPADSVHCVVTSPPYFGLRDYGTAQWDGGDAGCDHVERTAESVSKSNGLGPNGYLPPTNAAFKSLAKQFSHTCGKCGARRVDRQIGLEPTPNAFVAEMVAVFREVRRVLRGDGTCWLNLGDSYSSGGGSHDNRQDNQPGVGASRVWRDGAGRADGIVDERGQRNRNGILSSGLAPKNLIGIPWRVAFALQADGWYLRQDIIWSKPNPMPESVTDRCTKAHEYLFMLSKSARYHYDADAIKEAASWDASKTKFPDGWDTGEGGHGTIHRNGREKGKKNDASDKQRGHVRRHAGFNDRWDAMEKAEQCSGMRNKRSVWTVATQPFSDAHFATFPPALIEPCIKAGCPVGGTVLDPFGGAGTTGLVADRLGRNAIMLELNPTYAEMARRRIANDAGMFAEVAAQ